MSLTIYGIKNCSTMKKAFDWLDQHGVAYHFHDYKKAAIDPATLAAWCARVGHEALINKRGTTWRKLTPEQQAYQGEAEAIALLAAHPSLIRRPVIDTGSALLIGFDAAQYATTFQPGARNE